MENAFILDHTESAPNLGQNVVTSDHPDSAPKSGQKLLIGRVDKKGDIFLSHDAEGFPNHPQMIWEHVPVFDTWKRKQKKIIF